MEHYCLFLRNGFEFTISENRGIQLSNYYLKPNLIFLSNKVRIGDEIYSIIFFFLGGKIFYVQ